MHSDFTLEKDAYLLYQLTFRGKQTYMQNFLEIQIGVVLHLVEHRNNKITKTK